MSTCGSSVIAAKVLTSDVVIDGCFQVSEIGFKGVLMLSLKGRRRLLPKALSQSVNVVLSSFSTCDKIFAFSASERASTTTTPFWFCFPSFRLPFFA